MDMDFKEEKEHLRWLNSRWETYNNWFKEHIKYLNSLIPEEEREKVGVKPYKIY